MKYNIAIGYDNDLTPLSYTTAESLMQKSSVPLNIMFLNRLNLREFTRPRGKYDSTEFSNSRFMVPYLFDYQGWTLFMDNDMIVDADIKELFDMRDSRYAVMCVHHNQRVKSDTKFLGHLQVEYPFKNWSSVMLFNNEKCTALTPEYVNSAHGLDLHQFKWTESHLIGDLPLTWNHLVDNENQSDLPPKIIHYTDGGPYFKETENCSHSDKWHRIYKKCTTFVERN